MILRLARNHGAAALKRLASAAGVLAVVLLVLPAVVLADMDDYRFAEGLLRKYKYADLAEEYAAQLEQDRDQPEDVRASAAFLLADILKARALGTQDSARRAELMKRYEEALEAAKRNYSGSRRAQFAELDIAKNLMTQGKQAAARALDAAGDQARQAALHDSAVAYERAVDMLSGIIESMDAQVDQLRQEDPEAFYKSDHPRFQEVGEILQKADFSHLMYADAYFEWADTLDDKDPRKAELLEKAQINYQDVFENHSSYFRMEVEGGIGWGKALGMRGIITDNAGLISEALDIFEAFQDVEPRVPIDQLPADQREPVMNYVLDTKAQAYYWTARLYLLLGKKANDPAKYEKAFGAVQRLIKDAPQAARRPFGRLAVLEMGKGMIQAGRAVEGAEAIVGIIEESRQTKGGQGWVSEWDIGPDGVNGCKALAEVWLDHPFAVSPASGYYTGLGYIFREMPAEAALALKSGLAAAPRYLPDRGTEYHPDTDGNNLQIPTVRSDRDQWRPLILWELGRVYSMNDHPIFASIAYFQILLDHPDFQRYGSASQTAQAAANFAVQALQPLIDAGDTQAREFQDELKRELAGRVQGGVYAVQIFWDEASRAQGEGRFKQAAGKYLQIPEHAEQAGKTTPVPFYLTARVMAGYCQVMAHRRESAPESLEQDGIALMQATIQQAAERNDPAAQAAGVLHLGGLVLIDTEKDVPTEEGLEVLRAFDDVPALGSQGAYARLARQRQVDGYVALGRADEASAAYQALADRFAGSAEHLVAAFTLGAHLANAAGSASGDEKLDLARRGAELIKLWWESEDRGNARLGTRFWVATVFQDGGFTDLAAPMFKKVNETISAKDPADLNDDEKYILNAARIAEAQSLLASGRHSEAVTRFKELREQDPADSAILKGLADAMLAWYGADASVRNEAFLVEMRDVWLELHARLNAASEHETDDANRRGLHRQLWNARVTILRIRVYLKDWGKVVSEIDMWELLGELDDVPFPEVKKEIQDIRERAKREGGI